VADDVSHGHEAVQPRQIIDDCVRAVHEGDFERYVGHLSEKEQVLQAGYVLFVTSLMSISQDEPDPEAFLVSRALKDLVQQHTVPENERGPEQHAAEQARQQMLSQAFQAAFVAPGQFQPASPHRGAAGIRQGCIELANSLRDPQRFLVAVLAELARPTHISGDDVEESKRPIDYDEVVEAYAQANWTVYARGDYAIALSAVQPVDSHRVPPPVSSDTTDSALTGAHPSPPAQHSPERLRIVFRKIEGVWKVDQLLPSNLLTPSFNTTPPTVEYPSANVRPASPPGIVHPTPSPPPASFVPNLR
jgi:hypothetical protein